MKETRLLPRELPVGGTNKAGEIAGADAELVDPFSPLSDEIGFGGTKLAEEGLA